MTSQLLLQLLRFVFMILGPLSRGVTRGNAALLPFEKERTLARGLSVQPSSQRYACSLVQIHVILEAKEAQL